MKFAPSLAVLALALSFAACSPKTETPVTPAAEAPVAETPSAPVSESANVKLFTIGSLQAAALMDADFAFPNDNKTVAINKTKADVDGALTAASLPTDTLHLSVQPMLVKTADKVILFDTGTGAGNPDSKLLASLKSAGIEPAAITDIFISHAHGDHVGGLVGADGSLVFPNAAVHLSANEWKAMQANAGQAKIVAAVTAKVAAFEAGAEVIPGVVKAIDVKGHTPGHSAYEITSDGDKVFYLGDTAHHSIISVEHPDWRIQFDGDAPTAEASRKQTLAALAASGERVYAVHFPFPGLGKFVKDGDTVKWQAE
jgi:glyoxylase-like metal-dependent hydrolase (beta-lactamase superfamily II)